MEALRPVVEKLGGEIIAWYYAFGDYDVVVLFDVPSNVNAAAFSMAIAGSGAVRDFKTTILMTPDEGFDALLLAQGAGYRPPGAWSAQPAPVLRDAATHHPRPHL